MKRNRVTYRISGGPLQRRTVLTKGGESVVDVLAASHGVAVSDVEVVAPAEKPVEDPAAAPETAVAADSHDAALPSSASPVVPPKSDSQRKR